jgi:hypothetical protein
MRVAAVQVCFCCGICHCIRCNALVAWGVQEDNAVHPLSEPADIFEKGSTVNIPQARCLPPPRCLYRVQDSQAIRLYEHACCVHLWPKLFVKIVQVRIDGKHLGIGDLRVAV